MLVEIELSLVGSAPSAVAVAEGVDVTTGASVLTGGTDGVGVAVGSTGIAVLVGVSPLPVSPSDCKVAVGVGVFVGTTKIVAVGVSVGGIGAGVEVGQIPKIVTSPLSLLVFASPAVVSNFTSHSVSPTLLARFNPCTGYP